MTTPDEIGVRRLDIQALAAGGRGLARHGGLVWFVPGAVPGDRVEAEVRRRRPRYVEARLARMIRPSSLRREPPCVLQGRCGGCPWMSLREADQREWKRRLLEEALARIGQVAVPEVEAVRVLSRPLRYRNRVELTLGLDDAGRPALGLCALDPHAGLVDVDRCLLQAEPADALLSTIRGFLLDPGRELERSLRGGETFRVVLRRSSSSGEILVVLVETSRPFPHAGGLAAAITERHGEVRGIVRQRNLSRRRGGARLFPVLGRTWIEERIGGVDFRLPASSFTQVSAEGGAALVDLVVECVGEAAGTRVLDLYGGFGAFSFALFRRGAEALVVCDADRDAIQCGRAAARRSGARRIELVHSDVRRFLSSPRAGELRANRIVANPPRGGLGPGVASAVLALRAERLILVSCDPATLARDLRAFDDGGYRIERIVPVDLFPQTAHVEAVVTLRRSESSSA